MRRKAWIWGFERVFIPRRLDKFLRDATDDSTLQGRDAIRAGRVYVNGVVCRDDTKLVFEEDVVTRDGDPLAPRTSQTHLMLNKPLGVTSSVRDPDGRADLGQFLAKMPRGVFPIGRLDRMTSGLLLFSTDGDLANAVLHPDHHTQKLYWLWLNEHVADDDPRLAVLTRGLDIRGRSVRVDSVQIMHRSEDFTELHVRLSEGKNRQIRRMTRALNFYLHALHRKAVGPLELGALGVGEFRPLSPNEVQALWQATGGRDHVYARKCAALRRWAQLRRQAGQPELRLEAWLASAEKRSSRSAC